MVKNKFILGVGAQKAGTTYLFKCIRKSKSVFTNNPKEMHIFDNSFFNSKKSKIEEIEKELKETNLSNKSRLKLKRQMDFIQTPERYFDFFADQASNTDITHFGEFTPSYCKLNPK